MSIGIIGAMEPEVAILKSKLANKEEHTIGGYVFYTGQLSNQDVVLVQSGIGKVAATIATTILINHFNPVCVINTGSAGGFDQELSIGDVVISSEVRHHDVDVTAFGYEMGQVPNMPAAFIPHPALVDAAEKSVAQLNYGKTKQGLITTGDSFICQPERIKEMRDNFPTMLAVEMEGAAIAQTCHQLETPFVVVRSLSDIAGKESPDSFEAYIETASKHSSEMVEALLTNLDVSNIS